jgi:predicted acetyltransferase
LQLLLPEARDEGLAFVELTTEADNIASQRVIEANGGEVIERFQKSAEYGGAESLRFRILLAKTAA